MANPRPTFFTTGNFDTRTQLRLHVRNLKAGGLNWTEIGKRCGVSDRTAKRVWEEDDRARKEARAAAYERSKSCSSAVAVTPRDPAALSAAVKIYAALVIALLILAAVVALPR